MKNKQRKRPHLGYSLRQNLEAYTFLLPFILGVAVFLAFPIFLSIKLAFGQLTSIRGFQVVWSGVQNFVDIFLVDTTFVPTLLQVTGETLVRVPLIVVFSLLLAVMLNKKIRCRALFRVIMFLPFLLGTGYIMQMLNEQGITAGALSLQDSAIFPKEFVQYMGETVAGAIETFFGEIVTVLWSSGVQILIFLSGLQSISSALYESARVDGATEFEMFWKITMPMIAPITVLNIIFSLVNMFTASDNRLLEYIDDLAFRQMKWESASAIGWVYFLFILLLLGLVFLFTRRLSVNDKNA